jgi:hypothetical protein
VATVEPVHELAARARIGADHRHAFGQGGRSGGGRRRGRCRRR